MKNIKVNHDMLTLKRWTWLPWFSVNVMAKHDRKRHENLNLTIRVYDDFSLTEISEKPIIIQLYQNKRQPFNMPHLTHTSTSKYRNSGRICHTLVRTRHPHNATIHSKHQSLKFKTPSWAESIPWLITLMNPNDEGIQPSEKTTDSMTKTMNNFKRHPSEIWTWTHLMNWDR